MSREYSVIDLQPRRAALATRREVSSSFPPAEAAALFSEDAPTQARPRGIPQDGQQSSAQVQKNPWILKRLSQKHKDMIALSLQGLDREKVGEYCGCTPQYVTMINRQPLAREYIADLESHMDLRLRGLYSRSLDALQAGLSSPRISDKLAAAQIQLRAIGKEVPGPDDSKQTAEDIVGAMLVQGTNVQVNINRR